MHVRRPACIRACVRACVHSCARSIPPRQLAEERAVRLIQKLLSSVADPGVLATMRSGQGRAHHRRSVRACGRARCVRVGRAPGLRTVRSRIVSSHSTLAPLVKEGKEGEEKDYSTPITRAETCGRTDVVKLLKVRRVAGGWFSSVCSCVCQTQQALRWPD